MKKDRIASTPPPENLVAGSSPDLDVSLPPEPGVTGPVGVSPAGLIRG